MGKIVNGGTVAHVDSPSASSSSSVDVNALTPATLTPAPQAHSEFVDSLSASSSSSEDVDALTPATQAHSELGEPEEQRKTTLLNGASEQPLTSFPPDVNSFLQKLPYFVLPRVAADGSCFIYSIFENFSWFPLGVWEEVLRPLQTTNEIDQKVRTYLHLHNVADCDGDIRTVPTYDTWPGAPNTKGTYLEGGAIAAICNLIHVSINILTVGEVHKYVPGKEGYEVIGITGNNPYKPPSNTHTEELWVFLVDNHFTPLRFYEDGES